MRVLVDESLSPRLADLLVEDGHLSEHITRLGLKGQPDQVIYEAAQQRECVLISRDLGFADITRYEPGAHFGIIAVRFPEQISNRFLIQQVASRLRTLDESDIVGNIVIMEPDRTRIRRKE